MGDEQGKQRPEVDEIRAALVEHLSRWDLVRLLEDLPLSLSTIYAVIGAKPVGAEVMRYVERWYEEHGRALDAPPLPTEEETQAAIEAVRASVDAVGLLETARAINVPRDAVERLLAGSKPRWHVRRKLQRWHQQKGGA